MVRLADVTITDHGAVSVIDVPEWGRFRIDDRAVEWEEGSQDSTLAVEPPSSPLVRRDGDTVLHEIMATQGDRRGAINDLVGMLNAWSGQPTDDAVPDSVYDPELAAMVAHDAAAMVAASGGTVQAITASPSAASAAQSNAYRHLESISNRVADLLYEHDITLDNVDMLAFGRHLRGLLEHPRMAESAAAARESGAGIEGHGRDLDIWVGDMFMRSVARRPYGESQRLGNAGLDNPEFRADLVELLRSGSYDYYAALAEQTTPTAAGATDSAAQTQVSPDNTRETPAAPQPPVGTAGRGEEPSGEQYSEDRATVDLSGLGLSTAAEAAVRLAVQDMLPNPDLVRVLYNGTDAQAKTATEREFGTALGAVLAQGFVPDDVAAFHAADFIERLVDDEDLRYHLGERVFEHVVDRVFQDDSAQAADAGHGEPQRGDDVGTAHAPPEESASRQPRAVNINTGNVEHRVATPGDLGAVSFGTDGGMTVGAAPPPVPERSAAAPGSAQRSAPEATGPVINRNDSTTTTGTVIQTHTGQQYLDHSQTSTADSSKAPTETAPPATHPAGAQQAQRGDRKTDAARGAGAAMSPTQSAVQKHARAPQAGEPGGTLRPQQRFPACPPAADRGDGQRRHR